MPEELEVVRLPAHDSLVDAEIDELLDACGSSFAQQTPSWRDVILGAGTDEPAWLGCRRAGKLVGLLPGFRFEGPLGAILTSVPHAGPLGGVACRDGNDRAPIYEALFNAYVALARELGCALATVISNPFATDGELYERFLRPEFALRNTLLALDLSQDIDPLGAPAAASATVRRNLRRARSGSIEIDAEQSYANVKEWSAIHANRHREIGATPLPEALFLGALEHMVPRDRARFFFVRVRATGEMASGGLYLRHGAVTDAFMPSMDGRFAELRPNYLLAAHTIEWARQAGCRYYNWQGSPPDSGVERFKRQWGSQEHFYSFFTRVTGDAARFRSATVRELVKGYRWHYALPYDQVRQDQIRQDSVGNEPVGPDRAGADASDKGESSRAGAWSALEEQG